MRPKEAVTSWREAHDGAGSWQDLWPCGGPTLEQPVPEGLHPMESTHTGAVHKELQPKGRTDVEKDHGGLSHERHPTLEQEKSTRWNVRWKEWQRQRVMNWVQLPSPSPCTTRGAEAEEIGSKVEPGKKGGGGGRCFKIWFYFSLPYSDLIGNKLN